MSTTVDPDLRLVLVAALAWLFEHDHPDAHAQGMDATIDDLGGPGELARAIDRLSGAS